MKTMILLDGSMVITIPKEEKQQQMAHLDSLEPKTEQEFEEITTLMNMVQGKPNLKLVKG